mgnify:FL=1
MIELQNVTKKFENNGNIIHAVNNVNLTIEDSEIFGFIGYSGAGKSTLVRCINLLEHPDSGSVIVDGVDLTTLTEKELREERKNIGMIFQQFNLLNSLTIYDNIGFSLKYSKLSKSEIDSRIKELADVVGISSQLNKYPSQLSGGQKQRVGIARALASKPKILLCDEATSALDPKTTESILELLKRLNKTLGITIVIITHEMDVIKSICDKVAIMENGNVVESDNVLEVFRNPKAKITRDFISTTSNLSKIDNLIEDNSNLVELEGNQRILRIDFSGSDTKDAIVSYLTKTFNVDISILFADIDVIEDTIVGSLIVLLSGEEQNQINAIDYLNNNNISTKLIKRKAVN